MGVSCAHAYMHKLNVHVCSGGVCVCFGRSGNGLGAASTRESDKRGRVQRLLHSDGLGFLLRLCSQEQDFPV